MTVIWRGGSGGTAALILQLRGRQGELSASHLPTLLPSKELHVIHWIGSWVCPRADLEVLEKSMLPRSFGCINSIRDLECLPCVRQKYDVWPTILHWNLHILRIILNINNILR